MESLTYLGVGDYIVIITFLLVFAATGVLFRLFGKKQETLKGYFLAERNMSVFPVIFSTTATMVSTGTMLGAPTEIYRYGIQHVITAFTTGIGMIVASYVFIPVYFQCGVSTVYEFLDLRFGKLTRYTVSAIFLIQYVLLSAAILYGPALALSAVTDLSFRTSVFVIGGVCTFYSAMGGLKGVIWTDVLQAFLMFIFMISFIAVGISDAGGVPKIYERAKTGERLDIFKFSFDLTTRYTFWNCFFRGFSSGYTNFGTSQIEVQRLISIKDCKRGMKALQLSALPILAFRVMCDLSGLILFSIYYLCDPILNNKVTGLTKYDQIVPYYLVSRFSFIPGLAGLCVTCIFSGCLSTISSCFNTLSTITVIDYLQPIFPNINEQKTVFLAKIFSLLYGVLCILLTLSFSNVQSLRQFSHTLNTVEGSMLAIFTIAVLTRKASDKCIFFGLLLSYPIICFLALGTLTSGYIEAPLKLSTSECFNPNNISSVYQQNFTKCCGLKNTTSTLNDIWTMDRKASSSERDISILFKISFVWLPVIGGFITFFMIFLIVLLTGWKKNVIDSDSKCLSPVTQLWFKKPRETSTFLLQTNDFKHKEIVFTPLKDSASTSQVES